MFHELDQRRPDLTWVGQSTRSLHDLEDEIEDYWFILTGRTPLPIDNGVAGLMETAVAIHTRALEIQSQLQTAEYHGAVPKGSNLYRFRTGPVRNLIEAAARAADLGSRRITVWQVEMEQRNGY